MVRINQVLHRRDEETDVSPRKRHDRDGRARPVDIGSRRPAEPEDANGYAQAANHGWDESPLGRNLMRRIFRHLWTVDEYVAEHKRDEAEKAADDYADVHETGAFDAEVVDTLKDVWNRSKEAEECGKLAGDVQTNESYDWFGEDHVNGSNQGYGDEHLDFLPCWWGCRLREAESLRLSSFKDGTVCLAATIELVNTMFECNKDIRRYGMSQLGSTRQEPERLTRVGRRALLEYRRKAMSTVSTSIPSCRQETLQSRDCNTSKISTDIRRSSHALR